MNDVQSRQFLPQPRQVTWGEGGFALTPGRLILLDAPEPQALRLAARTFQMQLASRFDISWETVASRATPADQIGLRITVMPQAVARPEGYRLVITLAGMQIYAHDPAGAFYAIATLNQLLAQCETLDLPTVEIEDWPDFPVRGVMLDISRDKVPQMSTLYALVDRLASWKINQLQLYTEHTFAYRQHPEVWAEASPITAEEVLALDAYCRELHITLVPNQNSFGHMARWLKHERYAHLAEIHGEFETPWGAMSGPFSLAPTEPGSLELIRSLYDELLPNFTARVINVGCDETFDLCAGKSKALCEARGPGRVYLDFLREIYDEVARRGYRMQFWGDMILEHPELIPELPRDVIALAWGYEADHPFDEQGARFAAAGIPFYVCPGTSAWSSIAGRTENALGNLRTAAEAGLKHGAAGYLITDWGDLGHWQPLPISFLGLGMGAAYGWCLASNREADVSAVISRFAFDDATGAMGRVAYDLGNVYRAPGMEVPNSSVLFWVLQQRTDERADDLTPADFERTLQAIDAALAPMDRAQMERPDAALIRREFELAARLLRHACHHALMRMTSHPTRDALAADLTEIIQMYRAIWLARNRPGGLADSVARFQSLLASYEE
jgi:hexosaminidase